MRKRASPAHGSHGSRVKKTDFSVSGTTWCDRLSALNRPLRATTAPVGSTKAEMPVFVEPGYPAAALHSPQDAEGKMLLGSGDPPTSIVADVHQQRGPLGDRLRASSGKMDS